MTRAVGCERFHDVLVAACCVLNPYEIELTLGLFTI